MSDCTRVTFVANYDQYIVPLIHPFFSSQSNIVKEAPLSTVMLVVVQYGFKRVQELSKLRKAKKDPRSSLTWTTEQEKKWQSSLETSRSCQVLWVS